MVNTRTPQTHESHRWSKPLGNDFSLAVETSTGKTTDQRPMVGVELGSDMNAVIVNERRTARGQGVITLLSEMALMGTDETRSTSNPLNIFGGIGDRTGRGGASGRCRRSTGQRQWKPSVATGMGRVGPINAKGRQEIGGGCHRTLTRENQTNSSRWKKKFADRSIDFLWLCDGRKMSIGVR